MKKNIKTRNLIIIILCITIIILGFGFAFLAMQLNDKNSNGQEFSLEFLSVTLGTPVQGGKIAPTGTTTITNSNQTIKFQFNLYSPRDEVSYKAIIKNTGTIDAEIVNLVEVPDYLNSQTSAQTILPVKISHNNITGRVIAPGEEIELNVAAVFDYKSAPIEKKVPYEVTLIAKSPTK